MALRLDGSSPLTRETLWIRVSIVYVRTVHPRLRGKLPANFVLQMLRRGSSPLTRETLDCASCQHDENRFIPAYAGNSLMLPAMWRKRFGSSPLTRETPSLYQRRLIRPRFIPAYAGNSGYFFLFCSDTSVHPRLRGKLPIPRIQVLRRFGSSPLTRETHLKWLQHYTNRLTAKLLKNISKQE